MPPTKPIAPDDLFALRFLKSYRYGFLIMGLPGVPQEDRSVTLNINPQSISMREPIATSVSFTQGGGKYIESRGGLVKHISISGTTGYLPPVSGGVVSPVLQGRQRLTPRQSLVPRDARSVSEQAKRSGFYAFYKLRYLFRKYMHERRLGNINVTMHYFDVKGDDYWRIEPQEFVMTRNARKPFSYDYNIVFQCIEPSDKTPLEAAGVVSRFTGPSGPSVIDLQTIPTRGIDVGPQPATILKAKLDLKSTRTPAPVRVVTARMKTMRYGALGYLKHLSGTVQRTFQNVLRNVNNVVGFYEDIYSTATTILDTPLVLLKQLNSSLTGMFTVMDLYAADNIQRELNEWLLEMSFLGDQLLAHFIDTGNGQGRDVDRENERFARTRGKRGATTDLLREADTSPGSLENNPFLGSSGLGLVTDVNALRATRAVRSVVINAGESIYDIAQRLLGSIQRFIDLILLNNLEHPYIVSDKTNKPANTLAWGEYIAVPATDLGSEVDNDVVSLVPTITSKVTRVGLPVEVIDETLSLPWREDQWVGYTVTKDPGGAAEESRVVVANTEDTLVVNRAWTVSPTVGMVYTVALELFDVRRPVSAEARAYGKDLLLSFATATPNNKHGTLMADIVLTAGGDLAVVRGLENMFQAITLRLQTEVGRHPFHPSFGVAAPVGRAWSENTTLFYTYFMRRSLLLDPRVVAVRNPQLELDGDTVSFSAEVQPVNVQKTHQFKATVR